jgi:dTDP-4-amino-4,6-dideoxygalactose transaminase
VSKRIPLTRPSIGEDEAAAVERVLGSGWLAGQGPEGRELEAGFSRLTGRAHGVAVNNCTAGLHLVLSSYGVGAGDEVVVADYSYVATAHAVVYCGATPRFADVDLETGTVDPDSVTRMITPRTKLILAVDALGMPADWRALEEIARHRGIGLVADTACSAGAMEGSRPAGSYGDAAVFSLHARKGITCGEGGVIVTDDDALAADVRSRAAFGVGSPQDRSATNGFQLPEFLSLGYNYKLSDVLAAIANVQLRRLPELITERRRLASRYRELLAGVHEVTPPFEPEGRQSAWQTYAVRLKAGTDRDMVVTAMRKRGIECNVGTFSLSRQRLYASDDSCPRSWLLADKHLAIPFFPGLSADEQGRVVDALVEVLSLARIGR